MRDLSGADAVEIEGEGVAVLDDLPAAVRLLELRDVVFLSISAVRTERVAANDDQQTHQEQKLMVRDAPESFDARVELVVRSPQAEFNLDVLATYSKTEPFLASPDVRRSFLEKVGIFVVWPYLRAELSALCASLDLEPIRLPVIRHGEVQVGETEPEDELRQAT